MDVPPKIPSKVRVQMKRLYCPHHDLSRVAYNALQHSKKETVGQFNNNLIAITLSALALEALANACGEKLVVRWKDYDNAPCVAKLRIISQRLSIAIDFNQEPWPGVLWLTKLRNRLAHARSEPVTVDEIREADITTDFLHDTPQSSLEKEITLSNANRAVNTFNAMKDAFTDKMTPEEAQGIISDMFVGSASVHHESSTKA